METTKASETAARDFRFPVQLVARTKLAANENARAEFRGRIESGRVSVDDRIAVLPSGLVARVQDIVTLDGSLTTAATP